MSRKTISFCILAATPLFNPKVVVTQRGYPALSCCIEFGSGKNVCKRISISNHLKRVSIKILMEFLSHTPFKCKELKLVRRIVFL